MAEYSYGVVVEKYPSSFGIWLLFRGTDSGLMSLDEDQCADPLRIGDIIQAKKTGSGVRFRRCWPFADHVWSDGTKLVVRTIVSYNKEITIDRGRWKHEKTDMGFVTLFSRDLGPVAAPVQWYNREFSDAGECHLFVYVEFLPRVFVNIQTDEHTEFFWTVNPDRISLPAVPRTIENPEKFLAPDELRRVPALTMQRLGNHTLAWSYALGDRVAIILDDRESEIGQWKMVTAIPSSPRDFSHHSCAYTILKQEAALPSSQPEIRIDKGMITMTLTLNRSESEHPKGSVRLWHEFWDMAVDYDDSCEKWIKGEANSQFRAIVEVSLIGGEGEDDGRRVRIRAIGPPVTPRAREKSSSLPHSSPALDDLDDLKKALHAMESNNNNNDVPCADKTTIDDKPMKKKQLQFPEKKGYEFSGFTGFTFHETIGKDQSKGATGDQKSDKEAKMAASPTPSWDDVPKKEMKSASKSSESVLDWKNWGKEEEEKKKEEETETKGTGQYDGVVRVTKGGFSPGGMTHFFGRPMLPENDVEKEKKESQKGWIDPDSLSARANTDEIIELPTRAFDDTATEKEWKAEMEKKGWVFPPEYIPIEIPEGGDGWEPYETEKPPVIVNRPYPMPVQALLSKRNIVRDVMKLKTMQCLITRVRFDYDWKKADRIQLFILSNTPSYVVHRIVGQSFINDLPEYTTVGNVVDVHMGRHMDGFFVHDEMWRFVKKFDMPMREVVYEAGKVKTLELIVTGDCLSTEAQNRHNHRWRWERRDKGRFTLLHELTLGNICYENYRDIDSEEHELYTYQMAVVPDEILPEHVYWKATEILWRIKKQSPEDLEKIFRYGSLDPPPPSPPRPEGRPWPPPKFREPVEFKYSVQPVNYYHRESMIPNNIVTVPREERIEEILALYAKLLENDTLMQSLFTRTGFDYGKKFRSCIEVAQTAYPHQKSMLRELQLNADFLFSIVENAYTEPIFRELGEKRLWKLLVKTCDGIKAFRNMINKR